MSDFSAQQLKALVQAAASRRDPGAENPTQLPFEAEPRIAEPAPAAPPTDWDTIYAALQSELEQERPAGSDDHIPLPPSLPTLHLPPAPARRRAARPSSSLWTGVRYAAAGFAAGLAVSHTIGFWGFMSRIVYNSDGREQQLVAAAKSFPAAPQPSGIVTGSLPQAPAEADSCISLVRDPVTGSVGTGTCPEGSQPLRDAGRLGRRDKAEDRASDVTDTPHAAGEAGPAPVAAPSPKATAFDGSGISLDLEAPGR